MPAQKIWRAGTRLRAPAYLAGALLVAAPWVAHAALRAAADHAIEVSVGTENAAAGNAARTDKVARFSSPVGLWTSADAGAGRKRADLTNGARMILTTASGSKSIRFVETGYLLTMRVGDAERRETARAFVPVFHWEDDTLRQGLSYAVADDGDRVSIAPIESILEPPAVVGRASGRIARATLHLPGGAPIALSVAVTSEAMLLVRFSSYIRISAEQTERQLIVLGLAMARQALNVHGENLRGVVIEQDNL